MLGAGSLSDFFSRLFVQSLPVSLLKVSILIAAAYLLSRRPLFRRLFLFRATTADKLKVFAFFGALVLLELWMNPSRFRADRSALGFLAKQDISLGLVTSVAAGFLVGPEMGFAVGFLTWVVTMAGTFLDLWSVTPSYAIYLNPELYVNSGIAAGVGGLLGGWMASFRPSPRQRQIAGFLAGAFSQVLWLSIGLFKDVSTTAGPGGAGAEALLTPELVAAWIAAIVGGGMGVLFFLWIIDDLIAQYERIGSLQIQRALEIANQTLPFLRQGLNAESAQSIAEIVYGVAEVGAVALTDGRRILAHVGAGSDHHHAGDPLPPAFPRESVEMREAVFGPGEIGCGHADCPLSSGVLSPLVHEGEAIGGVLIFGSDGRATSPEMVRLGVGLAQFFGNYQVELAELERQTQAASQAELKALQSQVHPHFLFNVLNTLAALCEIDPKAAGKLTVRLAAFLRRSLRELPAPLIPLREEAENVRSYVEIEQARFQDRLLVTEALDAAALDALVPSFGLQVLVENAILHGTSKRPGTGRVTVRAEMKAGRLWCAVQDDGPGFTPERQREVFSGVGRASGLRVLRERGRRLLGRRFRLRVVGTPGAGTTVVMAVPQPAGVAGEDELREHPVAREERRDELVGAGGRR